MDRKAIIAALVAAVVFGAIGFGAGVMLGKSTASGAGVAGRNGAGMFGQNGQFRQNGQNGAAGQGRGLVVGKVTEVGKDNFVVKLADGSTRTVYVSSSTAISKTDSATIAAISKDTTVSAMGTTTGGGDITAQRVTIGDLGAYGRGMVPRAQGQNGTSSGGQGGFDGPPPGMGGAPGAP